MRRRNGRKRRKKEAEVEIAEENIEKAMEKCTKTLYSRKYTLLQRRRMTYHNMKILQGFTACWSLNRFIVLWLDLVIVLSSH